jgi:alpha-D-xyloside xylohydrolase
MAFSSEDGALIWRSKHQTLRIEAWGASSLRVRATLGPNILLLPGALNDAPSEPASAEITLPAAEGDRASIESGRLLAEVTSEGRIVFRDVETGELVLAEPEPRFIRPPARAFRSGGGELSRVSAEFLPSEGERFYGLGQHQHGLLDQKGCVIELWHRNTEVSIPFLVSSRGYGFLWHTPSVGRVELGRNGTRWIAEAGRQIDYWITAGSYSEIMAHYADATGHAPMLPAWAAGFWQSKLRYSSQEELLGVAREYHRRGLPLDVIVADFFHWTRMGEWKFDPCAWPDPGAMIRELDQLGVRLMVSIWPTVNAASDTFDEMERLGLLVRAERGIPGHMVFIDAGCTGPQHLRYYDATHPEARRYVWNRVREGYYRHGVRVWWLDACEPEAYPPDFDNMRYHLGNGLEVAGLYPLLHQQGFFDGMKAAGEQDVVLLCRSAWVGSQRYGAAVWSGDIASTFEALAAQVRAGLNIGLSGIPWWTSDIGGFHGGDPDSPYFRELIVRWFQYGVFCPLFRLHGMRQPTIGWDAGGPNEVWSFGDEAYEIIRGLLFLRQRLRPYILEQMAAASRSGTPPMRPLFYDFPEDSGSSSVEDQFMFGPDILVAPVLVAGAASRSVYLPQGSDWFDAWTGAPLQGGVQVEANAPLARIPVFVRDSGLLPLFAESAR